MESMMSTKATVWLAATCLIVIVQVISAWEAQPCEGNMGELISLEVSNCPNKTGEYCEFKKGDNTSYDIEFQTGVTYKDAFEEGDFGKSFYIRSLCRMDNFCPGKEGERRAYHVDQDTMTLKTSINYTGQYQILIRNQHWNPIFCIEFPVKVITE